MPADHAGRRRSGVIGSPISHSLSPVLHRAAYAELGLDWAYDAHEVTARDLDGFMAGLSSDWVGLSVTMPLKVAALRHSDDVDEAGAAVGAVNTLVRYSGDGWSAANTDTTGFEMALAGAGVTSVRRAAVLGAGATAASAIYALARLGAEYVTVLARSKERAARLDPVAERVGVVLRMLQLDTEEWPQVDVLVSTIPATAQAGVADRAAASASTVFDVTYDPAQTPLLNRAQALHRRTVPGFELLLHQAARQVGLMTVCDTVPLAAMRSAGEAALRRMSPPAT